MKTSFISRRALLEESGIYLQCRKWTILTEFVTFPSTIQDVYLFALKLIQFVVVDDKN